MYWLHPSQGSKFPYPKPRKKLYKQTQITNPKNIWGPQTSHKMCINNPCLFHLVTSTLPNTVSVIYSVGWIHPVQNDTKWFVLQSDTKCIMYVLKIKNMIRNDTKCIMYVFLKCYTHHEGWDLELHSRHWSCKDSS